jgi:hypothetical protein
MANLSWILAIVGSVLWRCAISAADQRDYKRDYKLPARIIFETPVSTNLLPDRIQIYKSGIQKESANVQVGRIFARYPLVCSVTNRTEIEGLVRALRAVEFKAAVSNVPSQLGNMYHIFLFNDNLESMAHFRAFRFLNTNALVAYVRPESESGFGYFNIEVLAWIDSCAVLRGVNNKLAE